MSREVSQRIQKTDAVIVDEVSMLSLRVFLTFERVCREVRGQARPFGGLQVSVHVDSQCDT